MFSYHYKEGGSNFLSLVTQVEDKQLAKGLIKGLMQKVFSEHACVIFNVAVLKRVD